MSHSNGARVWFCVVLSFKIVIRTVIRSVLSHITEIMIKNISKAAEHLYFWKMLHCTAPPFGFAELFPAARHDEMWKQVPVER